MKNTRETIKYDTLLCKGISEATADGHVYPDDGPDEPFVVAVRKVTRREVFDGRGKNWRESSDSTELILELTLDQAGALAAAIVSDLAYAASVGERRAITEEKRRG